ncbi:MAG TPA: histidine phosphatase family protein [Chthoniobacterales bacterium]|nr:histidine phosphatase family protein [Chthoniobacterales bacterium]
MTKFLFIRHGAHDLLFKRIAGRQAGVHLNELGREQAAQLAERLSQLSIEAIYSGPLERARETAEPICRRLNLPLQIADEFTEIDPGEWANRTFEELAQISGWSDFNVFRSCTAAPGGESMLEVQVRVVRKLHELRKPHQFVAIFSHGDVIRAIAALVLGMPLDLFLRIEIDPASMTLIEMSENFARVRFLNLPCEGAPLHLPD